MRAIDAYAAGKYAEALNLYESALQVPFGNQFRVFSGIYLANWKLGGKEAATPAPSGQLVDFGLDNKRVGVKFLFRPGTTAFLADRKLTEPYPIWLSQLAARAASKVPAWRSPATAAPPAPSR